MTERKLLTGIRDVDREILNKMSDNDFLQMCSLNRTYSQRVCDDTYFRLRTEARFPETIQYKDSIKIKSWKNHYLTIVKYIDLLEKNYEYIYKKLDKSPELLYLARQLVANYSPYTKNQALISASEKGRLPIVKYLVENGADIAAENNFAVIVASATGYLSVVKYLVEHGVDITSQDNNAVRWASEKGHLLVVKYLLENGADITADENEAVRWASRNGYLPIVKYLVENGADITARNNEALRWASRYGSLDVLEYLQSLQ